MISAAWVTANNVDKIRLFGYDQCSANTLVKLPVLNIGILLCMYACVMNVSVWVLLYVSMLMLAFMSQSANTLCPVLFQLESYQSVWWVVIREYNTSGSWLSNHKAVSLVQPQCNHTLSSKCALGMRLR